MSPVSLDLPVYNVNIFTAAVYNQESISKV